MKRSLRGAAIGSPVVGLALALAGVGCGHRGGAATSTGDTRSALAAEQAHILERFGGLTRIQDILAAG